MSKQASPIAVGSFVIGAIVLIVAGVLILGSGKFFTETHTAVAVFPGNVKGLNVGAAVEFRGVRIGSVKNIKVLMDLPKNKVYVPVYFDIESGVIADMNFDKLSEDLSGKKWRAEVEQLIEAGLKAQLVLQSVVTGQSIIDIDFRPNERIELSHVDPRHVEFPTVETTIGKLMNKLENLPLSELVQKALDTLAGIDELVRSQDLKESLHNVNLAVQDARTLLSNVDEQVQPLSGSAKEALNQVQRTLASVEKKLNATLTDISRLTRNVDRQVKPLAKSATGALDSVDDLIGKDSPTRASLDNTLDELAAAARSLRILADYLERHPEALIKGKGY